MTLEEHGPCVIPELSEYTNKYLSHKQSPGPWQNESGVGNELFKSLTLNLHFLAIVCYRHWKSSKQLASLASAAVQLSTFKLSLFSASYYLFMFLPTNFLFFNLDSPFCFSSLFLFLCWFWNDLPTKEGCSFNAKLFATCPKWSFFTINILFSSPRWAVYARTQEQNASLASFFMLD